MNEINMSKNNIEENILNKKGKVEKEECTGGFFK